MRRLLILPKSTIKHVNICYLGQSEGAGGSIRWVEDFRLAMLPLQRVSTLIHLTFPLKIGQMHTSVAALTD